MRAHAVYKQLNVLIYWYLFPLLISWTGQSELHGLGLALSWGLPAHTHTAAHTLTQMPAGTRSQVYRIS